MPELPEVEIVRRALEPVLVGKTLEAMVFHRPDIRFPLPENLPKNINGQRISSLQRRGKYILAFAENRHGFVLHLGMSGVIRIERGRDVHILQKHDHVEFFMQNGVRIVFNDPRRFGFLDAVCQESWTSYKSFKTMGPEPLSNDFSGQVLFEIFSSCRAPVKSALLDQKKIAGIGNIYACEALYLANISPFRIAQNLSVAECEELAKAIRDVLNRAIESGGSSLKDYKHTDGKLGYFQHHFAVYDREGEVCRKCKCDKVVEACVKRVVQSGRSTFYCQRQQV